MTATSEIRNAAAGCGHLIDYPEFDEWLGDFIGDVQRADHDAWAKNRTPADLIQAAWEMCYPVPEGREIPAGASYMWRVGSSPVWLVGVNHHPAEVMDGAITEYRTLEPLPPLIPDDCSAVWASTKECSLRRVLVNTDWEESTWRDGDGDLYTDDQLIDPRPIPEEDSNE